MKKNKKKKKRSSRVRDQINTGFCQLKRNLGEERTTWKSQSLFENSISHISNRLMDLIIHFTCVWAEPQIQCAIAICRLESSSDSCHGNPVSFVEFATPVAAKFLKCALVMYGVVHRWWDWADEGGGDSGRVGNQSQKKNRSS